VVDAAVVWAAVVVKTLIEKITNPTSLSNYTFIKTYDMPTYLQYTNMQYKLRCLHPILPLYTYS
jgi:hypothetical protein